MSYTPPYPGGWEDFPNTSTPITAAALDTMDTGIGNAQGTADAAFSNAATAQGSADAAYSLAFAAQSTADAALAASAADDLSGIIAGRIFA